MYLYLILQAMNHEFLKINDQLMQAGFTALLFRFRFFIGRLFKWDNRPNNRIMRRDSIRERYANLKQLDPDQLIEAGDNDFVPVYILENESLAEIENSTVHAALHLGRVPINETHYTVQMAVYVKAKGKLGKLYMGIIKPFRFFIVYPTIMRLMKKQWEYYKTTNDKE